MATLTVSVPDSVEEWIDEKIRTGEFDTSSDYFVDLVERDRALADDDAEELGRIVEEARASGFSDRTVDDIFSAAVERARAKGTLRD
ncbi:ribbon-helix-helix domain-containing protein [Mesorhizobium sp. ASY16-5R]|uniref:ribbon-helix-helix domain-containing protein n=1 Tax=Mesorhizobium sp. ASY16-5R TaxID=3445772 RepID=UPI003F9F1E7D